MLFSEKLKILRKGNNLTQEELAYKLNVSRQAITKWETNEGMPDIENIKQISNLFNVSIDELLKEDINVDVKKQYNYIKKLEIDHTKHFDINISKIHKLNIKENKEEIVKVELLSNEEENLEKNFKIKFDNLYNKLDIDIKGKTESKDITINLSLPQKYIDEIELNSKIKTLNIENLNINKLEYDGNLKYLNVKNSKGKIVLNTSKCDIEADYDKFEGILEVNTINSVARVKLPKESLYKTVLKGMKNEFIDAVNTEDAKNIIELNGVGSKLIIIQEYKD